MDVELAPGPLFHSHLTYLIVLKGNWLTNEAGQLLLSNEIIQLPLINKVRLISQLTNHIATQLTCTIAADYYYLRDHPVLRWYSWSLICRTSTRGTSSWWAHEAQTFPLRSETSWKDLVSTQRTSRLGGQRYRDSLAIFSTIVHTRAHKNRRLE